MIYPTVVAHWVYQVYRELLYWANRVHPGRLAYLAQYVPRAAVRKEVAMPYQGSPEFEATRRVVLRKLDPWVSQNPDEEVFGAAGSGQVFTRRQILNAVQQRTEVGQRLLERWHNLALEEILAADLSDRE